MSLSGGLKACALAAAAAGVCASAQASKLVEVRSVDDEHIMVYWQDARMNYQDDGKGPTAFMGHETRGGETITTFGPPLDTKAAQVAGNYTLASKDDAAYSQPLAATAAYRKTKVSGTDSSWPEAKYTLEHTVYLKLPQKLQQGKHYTLNIDPATKTDITSREITFDIYNSISEAIHVNIIGYNPEHTAVKSADLYMWMGDGGARDYSSYVGKPITLYNVATGEKNDVGAVKFWKKRGSDFGGWNLTKSDVWNCDFSAFTGTGKYRLVVDGVGCSPDFEIKKDIYYEPFKTSVRGFFYMRIGMGKEFTPVPRQPRLIQGVDPADLKVYRTTLSPWHPEWGRPVEWDTTDWSKYNEPGNPTNPDAWGGHSDATDWDRNPTHVSIVWDMLLPYILSNGKIGDDNLGIAESGNGIPDIIDEAQYEVDFWLRCRDGKGGYCAGVNNPPGNHKTLFQAAAKPYMAWVSAANCAMLADAYRIAGKPELMKKYADAAAAAWKAANEEDLDITYGIGNASIRGRDLKMLAAASLYNITGDRTYEDVVVKETTLNTTANIDEKDKYCQYWPTASYLMCNKFKWQPIHHPELVQKMQTSVIAEAIRKNVAGSEAFPSRRSSDTIYGWFQATQFCDALCIAHAVATDPKDQERLLAAMILESDYGLGRNCLNMVHMTGLGSRAVEDIYTTGRNDGTPGVHPGHTPYMNSEAWGTDKNGAYQHDPKGWYGGKGYPAWEQWPQGEALWHARYCYCNNEFTPQQTMRGKTALLGYLYSLGETHSAK